MERHDFDRAFVLLHVLDLARKWGPSLQHIHDAAMEELKGMKKPDPAARPVTKPIEVPDPPNPAVLKAHDEPKLEKKAEGSSLDEEPQTDADSTEGELKRRSINE